jgi:hypothetical protein
MAKTSLDTLKYFKGNYEQQDNFIKNCLAWVFEQYETPLEKYYPRFDRLELLHAAYREGVLKGWLACSYPEFEKCILGSVVIGRRSYDYPRWSYVYYRDYPEYRDGPKYRKNKDHAPKEENPKAAWREYKRFKRDKVKHRHWGSGRRNVAKKIQNRKRRGLEHMYFAKGDWDAYLPEVKADPWMWD